MTVHHIAGKSVNLSVEDEKKYKELLKNLEDILDGRLRSEIPTNDPYFEAERALQQFIAER